MDNCRNEKKLRKNANICSGESEFQGDFGAQREKVIKKIKTSKFASSWVRGFPCFLLLSILHFLFFFVQYLLCQFCNIPFFSNLQKSEFWYGFVLVARFFGNARNSCNEILCKAIRTCIEVLLQSALHSNFSIYAEVSIQNSYTRILHREFWFQNSWSRIRIPSFSSRKPESSCLRLEMWLPNTCLCARRCSCASHGTPGAQIGHRGAHHGTHGIPMGVSWHCVVNCLCMVNLSQT